MNVSIPMEVTEFLNVVPINPLISKCQIKVCWVGEEPNRNKTVITKETAMKLAPSLPGCPIVGYFNSQKQDFEEHNRSIKIANGKFAVLDDTKPYGFVDMNPKIWFQYFLDFDGVTREYLMTEGYIWTGIYEESKRIPEKGNNQSMELDEKSLQGKWAKLDNGNNKFFIINDGLFKKLCVLGEDVEPCFEGAQIATEFSLSEEFKKSFIAMAKELKEILREGGQSNMDETKLYEDQQEEEKKVDEAEAPEVVVEEVVGVFKKKEDEKEEEEKKPAEEEEKKDEEPVDDDEEDDEDKKKKTYSLEDVSEYQELVSKYSELENQYNDLKTKYDDLAQFKANIDMEKKEEMINSFYMLSDEDKKDVTDNIATYSLEEIESKLSVICFRNKVSFNLETEEEKETNDKPTTFNLQETDEDVAVPAWIKAVNKRKNQ